MSLTAVLPRPVRGLLARLRPYRPYDRPAEQAYAQADPWGFLRKLDAVPQRSVIAGYIQHLVANGDVLDVGCGEGLILNHLGTGIRYTGVDLSAGAIGRAQADFGSRAIFHVGDATTYTPEGQFDAIVFNESIYYMPEPAAVVRRYEQFLRPGGHLIVSMYDAPTTFRTWAAIGKGRTAKDMISLKHPNGNRWEVRLY